jgi:hypothetical protein
MRARTLTLTATLATTWLLIAMALPLASRNPVPARAAPPAALFEAADRCQACHNNLVSRAGEDVSIGTDWRASMMAQSARDPYWQAGVRRELLDHPKAAAAIEHECSRCHMPMAHVSQVASGQQGTVFASRGAPLAMDGVSCTTCHQIEKDNLGTSASFTGHFVIATASPAARAAYGPFAADPGLQAVMQSATGFRQADAPHVQSSELCATCHTLFTHALDEQGAAIAQLPEQVPYLEWRHSAYREATSCQTCHMPVVADRVRVSSTLGEPRAEVSRHTFRGANVWMLRVLHRFRDELGVQAPSAELELAGKDTLGQLQEVTAQLTVLPVANADGRVQFDVQVVNRAGHKLPTAYPSRRVWLHVTVRDEADQVLFESGAVTSEGAIVGNDNDADGTTYEPHHLIIRTADQVQIYEDIMVDRSGAVTTGLLSAARYIKDNRLLPEGFDKTTASPDVAVHGAARDDADFTAGGDRVRYDVDVTVRGGVRVDVQLLYQSIGFRWADNLRARPAPETERFGRYYAELAHVGTTVLAQASITLRPE